MNKSKTKKLIKDLKNFKPKLPAAFYLADAKTKKVFKFAKTPKKAKTKKVKAKNISPQAKIKFPCLDCTHWQENLAGPKRCVGGVLA